MKFDNKDIIIVLYYFYYYVNVKVVHIDTLLFILFFIIIYRLI